MNVLRALNPSLRDVHQGDYSRSPKNSGRRLLSSRPRTRRAAVEDFYDEVPSVARLDGVIEVLSSDRSDRAAPHRPSLDRNYSDTMSMRNEHQHLGGGYTPGPSHLREAFSDSDVSESFQDHEHSESHDESTATTSTPSAVSEAVMPPPPQLYGHTATDTTERIDRVIEIPKSSEDMSVTSETVSDFRSDVTPTNPLPTRTYRSQTYDAPVDRYGPPRPIVLTVGADADIEVGSNSAGFVRYGKYLDSVEQRKKPKERQYYIVPGNRPVIFYDRSGREIYRIDRVRGNRNDTYGYNSPTVRDITSLGNENSRNLSENMYQTARHGKPAHLMYQDEYNTRDVYNKYGYNIPQNLGYSRTGGHSSRGPSGGIVLSDDSGSVIYESRGGHRSYSRTSSETDSSGGSVQTSRQHYSRQPDRMMGRGNPRVRSELTSFYDPDGTRNVRV